jgi:hypothetical protein
VIWLVRSQIQTSLHWGAFCCTRTTHSWAQLNANWQIILYAFFIKGGQILAGINQSNGTAATFYTLLVQTDTWATHTETEDKWFPRSDLWDSATCKLAENYEKTERRNINYFIILIFLLVIYLGSLASLGIHEYMPLHKQILSALARAGHHLL